MKGLSDTCGQIDISGQRVKRGGGVISKAI